MGVDCKISDSDRHLIEGKHIYLSEKNGYVRVSLVGKNYVYLHRLIIGAKKGEIVDHINRDKLDNRRLNLRIVSASLNLYNKEIKNKLGRGVYFDKAGNRYRACISHNNKTLKLGSFKTVDDAKEAYNKKAKEIYGKDAYQHELKK